MTSRFEELLKALLNGETSTIVPQSRLEACLKNCIDGLGTKGLPAPQSRIESYLHALAEKMAGGGGGSTDEDLVEAGYTLKDSDILIGRYWITSNPNDPFTLPNTDTKFCTRKFELNRLPRISYNTSITTLLEVYLFCSGVIVGVHSLNDVYDNAADLVFDEIAFNFSWGGSNASAENLKMRLVYPTD